MLVVSCKSTFTICANDVWYIVILTTGRVHPENVCATQENLQATVSWSFDKEVVDRILEFKVVLSPKKGRGDPIAKTVDKESGHATLQLCPDCEYMPAVTAVYTDNERFKCKGTSLRTPGTLLHRIQYTIHATCLYRYISNCM